MEDLKSGEITPLKTFEDFQALAMWIFLGVGPVDASDQRQLLHGAESIDDVVLKLNVPADDVHDFDLSPFFESTNRLLIPLRSVDSATLQEGSEAVANSWLTRPGILVHCQAGASRSASILAAYLIATYGIEAQSAIDYLESRRPQCVNPNPGFRKQLAAFAEKLTSTS